MFKEFEEHKDRLKEIEEAGLSCVYLHLYSKSTSDHSTNGNNKGQRQYFGSLKRTVVVMEPLGIVNAVELTFAAMFTLLLIWSLVNYIYVSYSNLHMHNPAVKVDPIIVNIAAGGVNFRIKHQISYLARPSLYGPCSSP
ncbi:hypothetical protein CQW23_07720 [Capsicum baccatum]|uniref:Uncharacterized protein n=1 Tax=Capsicum baccatum TaxID=33114 RepID=A0A2G2X6X0_CAPBA|nr:hypothetical protein CQW23_07720 [Capsicum baccatum]